LPKIEEVGREGYRNKDLKIPGKGDIQMAVKKILEGQKDNLYRGKS